MRVAVIGAKGRMGSTVCQAVTDAQDMELVASIDAGDDRQILLDAKPDVCVEFSTPATVKANVLWLVEHGIHAVVGATGMTSSDLEDLRAAATISNVMVIPNFAISAVLMVELSRQVAKHMTNVEIIELHHDKKVDAPSGTAIHTAQVIAANRPEAPALCGPEGHGARGDIHDGIAVHSVRLPGLVAHQEVIFTDVGQALTIRQDSFDRTSFMPGVLLACRNVANYPGLNVGLETILFS